MPLQRCPYCRLLHGPAPSARCPRCGKTAILPPALRRTTFRERQRLRQQLTRDHERQDRQAPLADLRFGRRPWTVGMLLIGLLALGIALIGTLNRAPAPAGASGRLARESVALRELGVLREALERFRADTGRYPTAEEGLRALVRNPGVPGWGGHYISVLKPDPWKTPYRYEDHPDAPRVRSAGPDRILMNDDDLIEPIPEND